MNRVAVNRDGEDNRMYKMGEDGEVSFEQVEFEIFVGHPSGGSFIDHRDSKEYSEC